MPGKHTGHPTISFRPSSDWQYKLIEERAFLSGKHKKDFIIRSCIYSNICVVGTKENINRILDSVKELQDTMYDITTQLSAGDICISEKGFNEFRNELLALCITSIEILDGASYLFDKKPQKDYNKWKQELELEQFKKILEIPTD